MILIPVIISGGAGTRLWPASRKSDPKPFINLPDGESIIQKTFSRCLDIEGVSDVVVVTNKDYFFRTTQEFEKISQVTNASKLISILEPVGRNTAPAIAAAALKIQEEFGDEAIMLVLPADHLIPDHRSFEKAVFEAKEIAEKDLLVTFGIEPISPETGFGYIEKGDLLGENGFNVKRFVEKPKLELAKQYLDSGEFVWNSGMFCFKAGVFLNELEKASCDIFNATKSCWQKSETCNDQIYLDESSFAKVDSDSIDYAVMEKSDNVAVVSVSFSWNDIGSWNSFAEIYDVDENGNSIDGDAITVDAANCIINSESMLTAVVGLDDVVVIAEDDAVLVASKEKVQDVKKVVEALKSQDRPEADIKNTVIRPWGSYTNLIESETYKVKRITVNPGQSLSLQKHHHRSEHWTVVVGEAEVVNGENTIILKENESTYIEKEAVHRLTNNLDYVLELIEVQCGSYLGEDDIVRLEDTYGRV